MLACMHKLDSFIPAGHVMKSYFALYSHAHGAANAAEFNALILVLGLDEDLKLQSKGKALIVPDNRALQV